MDTRKVIALGVCGECDAMFDVADQTVCDLLPCGHKVAQVMLSGSFVRDAVSLSDRVHSTELCQDCAEALELAIDADQ